MNDQPPQSVSAQRLDLFLVSFCILFFEVMFIRWIPSQISFVGTYSNFVLVSVFLGLGLGCLLGRVQHRLLNFFPVATLAVMALVLWFRKVRVISHGVELIFLDAREAPYTLNLQLALAFVFVAVAICILPLGHELGKKFQGLQPIPAYTINIGGSLAGIFAFSLMSYFGLPASVWVTLGFVALAALFRTSKAMLGATAACLAIALGITVPADLGDQVWSPYHRISFSQLQINKVDGNPYPFLPGQNPNDLEKFPPEVGFNVEVNGLFYQQPLDLSQESVARTKLLKHLQFAYDTAYTLGSNKEVLIVGGGSGNDCAAALRNGAEHVDVVDIDPELLKLGLTRHPQRPYLNNDRVSLHVADGRTFFKRNAGKKKYDKIVFGLLDSHIQMSSKSNLRIDSFIYTVESFRDAAKLLNDDGIMVVSFTIASPVFSNKLYAMLKLATGDDPVVYSEIRRSPLGVTVVSGPGARKLYPNARRVELRGDLLPATDDWPFFYLTGHEIGETYLTALALVLGISTVSVFAAGHSMRRGVHLHFFALGAAFMLLESKSITTLALLFGSTWMTNSLVFASVLVAILLANLYVLKFPIKRLDNYYVGLGLSILWGYLLQSDSLSLTTFVTFLPIFFAGIIFADSFSRTANTDYALGSNILGGVLGACVEYTSMQLGFRALLIIVAGLYLVSYVALLPHGRERLSPGVR